MQTVTHWWCLQQAAALRVFPVCAFSTGTTRTAAPSPEWQQLLTQSTALCSYNQHHNLYLHDCASCYSCGDCRHVICDIAICTVPLQHFCDSVTLISACIIIIIIISVTCKLQLARSIYVVCKRLHTALAICTVPNKDYLLTYKLTFCRLLCA